jgi:NADPH:quinone reductase-like Zn-dependent oxidoreductase
MKAIVHDRYGSPDVLRLEDVDPPVPGDHDVLVRVRAASVNARDWHLMRGDPYLARVTGGFGIRRPKSKIRGTDFAGRVEAVGRAVTRLRPGDEVFGQAPGAFAEYACAPDDRVDRKPPDLTFEAAAALPTAGITALFGLRDVARLQPGQRILVNGASGGVGLFAVQLAKAYGAVVTAVCSTRNVELVGEQGADHVVDYTRDDFARAGQRHDVVLDLVGNRSLADLQRVLTPTGLLLLSGGGVSEGGSLVGPMGLILRAAMVRRFVRQRLVVLMPKENLEALVALRQLAESGSITPVIERTYPLAATADAIRCMEVEHARAKLVITVSESIS